MNKRVWDIYLLFPSARLWWTQAIHTPKVRKIEMLGTAFYFYWLMEQMLLGSQQLPSTSVVARPWVIKATTSQFLKTASEIINKIIPYTSPFERLLWNSPEKCLLRYLIISTKIINTEFKWTRVIKLTFEKGWRLDWALVGHYMLSGS